MVRADGNENWTFDHFPLNRPAEDFGAGSRFVENWNEKRQNHHLPSWNDFELEEFFEWGGRVMLLDVVPSPFDVFVRWWGTTLVNILGYDRTGMLMSEIDIPDIALDLQYYKELCETPCLGMRSGPVNWKHRQTLIVSHLDMPLSSDGHTVDKILSLFSHRELSPD